MELKPGMKIRTYDNYVCVIKIIKNGVIYNYEEPECNVDDVTEVIDGFNYDDLKPGTKVYIKNNLVDGTCYGNTDWDTNMKKGIVTISKVLEDCFNIKNDIYYYTKEMIAYIIIENNN